MLDCIPTKRSYRKRKLFAFGWVIYHTFLSIFLKEVFIGITHFFYLVKVTSLSPLSVGAGAPCFRLALAGVLVPL